MQTLAYPNGFTINNTLIIGARVKTKYNTYVPNDYDNLYKVLFTFADNGITYVNHESNSVATDFVIIVHKFIW